ncbi:MAG: hypothetical protein HY216_08150 [Candidatus Rokubacteria bacterium]|nr:hypothetical protein [Candidatus Rokubacteria bacterium]
MIGRAWRKSSCWYAVAAGFLLLGLSHGAASAADRLERFRELAQSRLGAQAVGVDAGVEAEREILVLLDEEIVESIGSGGVFASTEFLQERLDGFAEAWGGAALQIHRLGTLVVGVFQLSETPLAGFVRVYGRLGADAALLATLQREGRPTVYALPRAPGGMPHFLVAWEGAPSGRGSRALRLDLVRQRGDGVETAWSLGDGDEPLMARAHRVSPRGEVEVRYELHYPGWTPGCDRQTEQEDVYRLAPAGTFARVSRRQLNPWHQALRQAAARLFAALAGGDRGALASVVPDASLRSRLPASLAPEPACDAADGTNPTAASVAAADARGPWALTFRQRGGRWHLTAATPVLE